MVNRIGICASFLSASLAVMQAQASDRCSIIKAEHTFLLFGEPAAQVQQTLDAVKREMCFRFSPLVPDMTIEPENLCVAVDEDEQAPVWIRFPSGSGLDIGKEYGPEKARWIYDYMWKSCNGLINAKIA